MRTNLLNVVIVVAKCCHTHKAYGIRMEEFERGVWRGTWAFPLEESVARKENYDRNTIRGTINFAPEYPGCPYCNTMGIFQCNLCNQISCYDGKTKVVTCAHCNRRITINGIIQQLTAGGDR